ncbi:hypothetical protein GUG23_18475 [Xanthomonas citri pv. citri]|nr:hypothetical protein [Xanthomonas citri pv. citri]MBD4727785.1 hypothetical protein [Xanthomonas citri pv. citri]MBD4733612.1 hypothetical protein [Xanthomonas citri pv. citri]MBD4738284.1 hypothetical protein [Xanthomonas citri pv. citri]MBD4746385.1 hypothetical protein [Xanthomonas citri pv. citri]
MHPRTRFRARCHRRLRNYRYGVLGFYGSVTFPIRKPHWWAMCKFTRIFFFFYKTAGRPDLALSFGRIWPAKLEMCVKVLNDDGDHRVVFS